MGPAAAAAMLAALCCGLLASAEREPLFRSTEYESRAMGEYPNVTFHTSDVVMPLVNMMKWDDRCESDELIMMTPNVKPLRWEFSVIADQKGHMVWGSHAEGNQRNLHVVKYRGQDYLAVWISRNDTYRGPTYYQLFNQAYEESIKIYPTRELSGDHHGFTITANDTALFLVYSSKQWDLRPWAVEDGWINDAHFQEIDIETGELLFEWRATDHFTPEDMSLMSLKKVFPNDGSMHRAWDAFHINSVQKDAHGNYLISMRYNSAVTYVSGKTGQVLWQLGGKNNSFTVAEGSPADTNVFMANHDAQFTKPDEITLFDNQAWGFGNIGPARGLKLKIDTENMTVGLVQAYNHPDRLIVESQGSHRVLSNGHSFMGWGHVSGYSEFGEDGELLCDAHFGPVLIDNGKWAKNGDVQSYRVVKQRWVGRPSYPPAVALVNGTLYVSWNGATEVRQWRLEGSSSETDETETWRHVDTRDKVSFETDMQLHEDEYVAWRVTAVDGAGEKLGTWHFSKDGKLSALASGQKPLANKILSHMSQVVYFVTASGIVMLLVLASRRRAATPIRSVAEGAWSRLESKLRAIKASAAESKYHPLLEDGAGESTTSSSAV